MVDIKTEKGGWIKFAAILKPFEKFLKKNLSSFAGDRRIHVKSKSEEMGSIVYGGNERRRYLFTIIREVPLRSTNCLT